MTPIPPQNNPQGSPSQLQTLTKHDRATLPLPSAPILGRTQGVPRANQKA